MVLTSMGVFGFLSKAHLDQAVPSGDVAAKVQIFDDKIRTQQDNIKAARAALTQMDAAVDQTMSRSTTEQGADKAANLRRSQARERTALQNDISKAQTEITKLQEQRAPIASEMRKVEAEVGPIKYIAALIYGDNPEANLLEKAVRWVIILIVIVFDPLALTLLLAATKTFEWERGVNILASKRREPEYEPDDGTLTDEQLDQLNKTLQDAREDPPDPVIEESAPVEKKKMSWPGFGGTWMFSKPAESNTNTPATEVESTEVEIEHGQEPEPESQKLAERIWKIQNPESTLKEQRRLHQTGRINNLPWDEPDFRSQITEATKLEADNAPKGHGVVTGFGIAFPENPQKSDMFLRVDRLPTQLYKFNGVNWIEVDKEHSDSYAYDDAYIDHLIAKIDSGEYDPELLNDAERDRITERLNQL
jgi:hypothetical protein